MLPRVQRRRGVALPAGTAYVGRPSRWGNPWRIGASAHDSHDTGIGAGRLPRYRPCDCPPLSRAVAVARYRAMWQGFSGDYISAELDPLRGATALACWCPPDEACHADVLIELLAAGW